MDHCEKLDIVPNKLLETDHFRRFATKMAAQHGVINKMDPKKLFIDERLKGICTFCGAEPDSRDHVPSRVLLDKPYPENLPVVESCSKCNREFSVDEEYLACFLECVIQGTTEPNANFGEKVARILEARPLIKARIRET